MEKSLEGPRRAKVEILAMRLDSAICGKLGDVMH